MSASSAQVALSRRPEPGDQPEPAADSPTLNLREIADIVGDLQQRSPVLYWLDLLLSAAGAWTLTAVYFNARAWSAVQMLAFLGASILFFRAGTFIHEIIHFSRREMVWFRRTWNLLVGIPLLMPWIMYRNHLEHHNAYFFGTPEDGEYLPIAAAPLRETFKYLLQAPILPLFVIARFGVLGPLSWLHRGLREWVLTAASAGVTNP
jgi:fatty acid desaturase